MAKLAASPPKGKQHACRLETSARLQRLLMLLSDGREHTTLQIIHRANVASVSIAVSELRHNGIPVNCRLVDYCPTTSRKTYAYQLAEFAAA